MLRAYQPQAGGISWDFYAGRACQRLLVTAQTDMGGAKTGQERKRAEWFCGRVPVNTTFIIRFSLCIPRDWPFDETAFGDPDTAVKLVDFHAEALKGSPLAMYITGREFRWDHYTQLPDGTYNPPLYNHRPVAPDTWEDWEITGRMATAEGVPSGFVDVKVNGARWFKRVGSTAYIGEHPTGPYVLLGPDTRPGLQGRDALAVYIQIHELNYGK